MIDIKILLILAALAFGLYVASSGSGPDAPA